MLIMYLSPAHDTYEKKVVNACSFKMFLNARKSD